MTNMPSSIVIGTAGHIDHGKTTLVRALTGIDTDRLPEEKRRGITIDLGFASFEPGTPNGSPIRISFVDVPGHSAFIRNMLAGAGCVPAVMLVVAANEGIMPQTVEHLAICDLLGISHGLTVITKTDTVSDAQLQEVRGSVERFLQGTFLARDHAPVIPASAATGAGLDSVRAELLNLAIRTHIETSDALMRMPLDRSFVMKGFGTVVTGTLLSGTIRDGETLHLQPGDRAVRVRGLQSHGESVPHAQSGSRAAVNLSGIDATQVYRGQMLVVPRTLSPVDTLDVEVHLLQTAPALKHRATIHFHAFTCEIMASVSLHNNHEAVQPGTVRIMRLKLAEPSVLVPGDRFVLRQPSPAGTIGGGRVLDAHPLRPQRKSATQSWLAQLRSGSPAAQLPLRVARREASGITLEALSAETGLTLDAIRSRIGPAIESGEIHLISNNLLLSRDAYHAASREIITRLQSGEKKSSELRGQAALSHPVFDFVIDTLVNQKKIKIRDETIFIYTAGAPVANPERRRLAAIAHAYEESGLAAPSVLELARQCNIKEAEMRRLVTALLRDRIIVRMGSDDLLIHSAVLSRLTARLVPLRGSLMDVASFKQLTGLTRKHAIPLLEYLDRQRITLKQGDRRLIL